MLGFLINKAGEKDYTCGNGSTYGNGCVSDCMSASSTDSYFCLEACGCTDIQEFGLNNWLMGMGGGIMGLMIAFWLESED